MKLRTIKNSFLSLLASSIIIGCGGNEISQENDKPIEVDFKAELEAKVNDFKGNEINEYNAFKLKIDSIKSSIKELEFDESKFSGKNESFDLGSDYFIVSIHDYDTLSPEKYPLSSENYSTLRKTIFDNTPTQTERDIKALDNYIANTTSDYDSDEKKLSIFDATLTRYNNYKANNYVIVIRDYVYIKPVMMMKEYLPAEVLSGVFLYDIKKGEVIDQFLVSATNKTHIQFTETGDLLKDQKVALNKLFQGIKSNYDKELKASISERYGLSDVRVFF